MGYRDRMRERVGAFRRWRPALPRVVAMMACGVLLASGCSGDDGSSVAATGESVVAMEATTTVAPTTTAPVTTTTAAPATTTSTTTTVSTTTTSTSLPEPSLDDLEAEIAAAYEEVYWGYWACLRTPTDCDVSWLEPDSGPYQAMWSTMEALAERDRFVGDDDVGYYVIESIEFSDDRTEATVVTCWWSTAVLYTTPADPSRPAGPDNPPTVVNNTPGSSRQRDVLVNLESSWVVRSSGGMESFEEEDVCEP